MIRFEISSKNQILRYQYFHRNKCGITSKLKIKSTQRFFCETNFEKKIRSQYHYASKLSPVTHTDTHTHTQTHTDTHTHTHARARTHTHTHKLILKTGFLASLGLKMCLYAKKSKFHLSQWFLYEEPKNFHLKFSTEVSALVAYLDRQKISYKKN